MPIILFYCRFSWRFELQPIHYECRYFAAPPSFGVEYLENIKTSVLDVNYQIDKELSVKQSKLNNKIYKTQCSFRQM